MIPNASDNSSAEMLRRDGLAAYRDLRDYLKASLCLKKVYALGAATADDLLILAFCQAMANGNVDHSIQWIDQAKSHGADNDAILVCKGAIEWLVGSKEQAIRYAKDAVRSSPTVQSMANLFAMFQDGAPEYAETICREMIQRFPLSALGFACLGSLLYERGLFRDCIKQLEHAHDLNPDDLEILATLGDAYFELKEYAKARSIFENIDQFEFRDPHTGYYLIGMCILGQNGDRSEAKRYFQRALAVKPDFQEATAALRKMENETT